MNFEERLLAELKAEVAERAARGCAPARRRVIGRRLLAGSVVAAVAAAAVVAMPLLTTSDTAYAVARNADGSITVQINEMRHPDRLEADLARQGVSADITYLPQHKRCANDNRLTSADPQPPEGLPMHSAKMKEFLRHARNWPSQKAFRWVDPKKDPNVFRIYPKYVKPGQTLVVEIAESEKTKLWKLGHYLAVGRVKPCVFEDDPYWN
jgi:hypothetical protein